MIILRMPLDLYLCAKYIVQFNQYLFYGMNPDLWSLGQSFLFVWFHQSRTAFLALAMAYISSFYLSSSLKQYVIYFNTLLFYLFKYIHILVSFSFISFSLNVVEYFIFWVFIYITYRYSDIFSRVRTVINVSRHNVLQSYS